MRIKKEKKKKKRIFAQCFDSDLGEEQNIDPIEWEWYNNDKGIYEKYHGGKVMDQIEASFQANLDSNFPFNFQYKLQSKRKQNQIENENQIEHEINESHFNMAILTELGKSLKRQTSNYAMRFMYTSSTKRITNIEQIAYHVGEPEFPRNIRRILSNTRKNTIYTYFLENNDFVEKWKQKYLLATDDQISYFWSHVLSIAATMKYMDCEMHEQFVTFNFPEQELKFDNAVFESLDVDTVDIRREIRELDLYQGFLVPPIKILQTHNVNKADDEVLRTGDYYKQMSTTIRLKPSPYIPTSDTTRKKHRDTITPDNIKETLETHLDVELTDYNVCPHGFGEATWKSEFQNKFYCDHCAVC